MANDARTTVLGLQVSMLGEELGDLGDLAGGPPTRLTFNDSFDGFPSTSPDGKKMFVAVGSLSNVAEGAPKKSPDEIKAWEKEHGVGAAWGDEANRADVLVFDVGSNKPGRPFAPGIRKMIYTTNAVEALHRSLRKIIKTRGSFPNDDAALKLLYLAIKNAGLRWRRAIEWTAAISQFAILFGDRFVPSAR